MPVRMEKRGKSSLGPWVTMGRCKPYPKQHRMGIVGPTYIPGWHGAKVPKLNGDIQRR